MRYPVQIDSRLLAVFPAIRLGLIRFHAEVRGSDAAFWEHMDQEVLPRIRSRTEGLEWSAFPGIRGSRAAYKAFGRDPGRYRVSSEALIRRIRRGDDLYRINSVVDVNNLLSVESGLSAGSYDLGKIRGGITLRKAEPGEGYNGIGKKFLDMENMLVLADDEGSFGSSMSDSTRAMVTGGSRDILVVLYCFEDDLDLEGLLIRGKEAFGKYASAAEAESWLIPEPPAAG